MLDLRDVMYGLHRIEEMRKEAEKHNKIQRMLADARQAKRSDNWFKLMWAAIRRRVSHQESTEMPVAGRMPKQVA
ncbi:MAG: hypothetical protein H3C34_00130 [Caldilineaceae bacterium]|nr:hypothetical protein [Caldilineaceae bacterium]